MKSIYHINRTNLSNVKKNYFLLKTLFVVLLIQCGALAQLSGNYTIGSGGDYTTLNDAVDALTAQGVSSAVTFNILNGNYNEQIQIGNIAGVSSSNTVTFQSQSGNPADVQINYNATGTSDNYVIRLDSAKFMIFQNITFIATGSSHCRVFQLSAPSSDITINNNLIAGGTTTGSSDNQAIIISINSVVNNLRITGNSVTDGSYAIYLSGVNTNNKMEGLEIIGNEVSGSYMGIRVRYADSPKFNQNTVQLPGGASYAFYLQNCDGGLEIMKNKLLLSNSHGIYLNSSTGGSPPIGTRGLIANNFISTGGGNYGFYISTVSNQDFYYNSVNLNSGSNSNSRAFSMEGSGSANNFVNNIFSNLGDGYAIYTSSPSAIATSDHNNIFSLGNFVAYWNSNKTDLSDLQSSSGKDANSVSVYPHFISNSDLHTIAPWLNAKGTPLARVTDDIDGEPRDANNPDIGADEFSPDPSSTTPMAGLYTIGAGGDYSDISSAADELLLKGMSGSITFNLLDGTYLENARIFSIAGQGDNDTIKIQSQSGNPANAIWYYAASGSGDNYVLRLKKAKNVIVQNLTLGANNASGSSFGTVILLQANNDNISITNNIIAGSPTTGSSDNLAIISGNNTFIRNLNISDNQFSGGSYSIYIQGLSNYAITDLQIINNEISGSYMGIRVRYADSPKFNQNTVQLPGGASYAFYLQNCDGGLEIMKNKLLLSNSHGIYLNSSTGGSPPIGTRGLIANNFISTGGGNYGLNINSVSNQDFYYNSVNLNSGSNSNSRASSVQNNGSGNNFVNNIFVNKGSGYAYYVTIPSMISQSDFNDIYTEGSNYAYWGSNVADLSALQTASGKDANSISVDPLFVSSTNLHVRAAELDSAGTPLARVTDDIDGDIRDENFPDIGADEFIFGFNYPPSITSTPDTLAYVDSLYQYQVIADDRDGDTLTYSLTISPTFLNIDENTGLVEGTPSASDVGSHPVEIMVDDGHGNQITQNYTLYVEHPTGIDDLANQIPDDYMIFQNYPNPFNPSTRIKFGLPESTNVIVSIYSITGEKVTTLINEERAAGYYELDFDASSLASGIYFYRIQAGSFNQVKKMLVIR